MSGLKIPLDERAIREKEVRDREKLKAMTEFAYSAGCRQQWILNYFGEEGAVPCGRCDQCMALGVEEGQVMGGGGNQSRAAGVERHCTRFRPAGGRFLAGTLGQDESHPHAQGVQVTGFVEDVSGPAEYVRHSFILE